MRGNITKRGSSYSIILDIGRDSKTGKRRQRWFSGYKTKKAAEKALSEKISEIENNNFIIPEKTNLKTFLNLWLDSRAVNLSPTTYNGYKGILELHLIPSLGEIELQKLQPLHIQKYYNEKFKTLSGKTLLQHHRVLRKALDYAWKMQLISKNPADMVEAPKAQKYHAVVLEPKQVKKLLTAVNNTRFEVPVNLALALGLRLGEILGLRWSDVDFDNEIITIEQTLVRAGTELIFKEPKTEGSARSVSAPIHLLKLLKEHKKRQLELKVRSYGEYNNNHNLVCTKDTGESLNTSTFSHAFGDFIKKLDIPHIRFHDLRHPYVKLKLKNNSNLFGVKCLNTLKNPRITEIRRLFKILRCKIECFKVQIMYLYLYYF